MSHASAISRSKRWRAAAPSWRRRFWILMAAVFASDVRRRRSSSVKLFRPSRTSR